MVSLPNLVTTKLTWPTLVRTKLCGKMLFVTQRKSRMSAQQRRESILTAATEVFAETGYQRGKTSAVAARLGVTEPVIFQNFGTKAALFAEVVRRAADQHCAFLNQIIEHNVSVADALAGLLDPEHLRRVH